MTETLAVLLVEDHRMFADAIRLLLDEAEGMDWVGTALRADEALRLCAHSCPDVILMDIDLPGMDGIETTRRVRELCPEVRVLVLTALDAGDLMAKAIEAGACGLVPKTQAADQLIESIRRAASGEVILPAGDLAPTLHRLRQARDARSDVQRLIGQLTDREIEILHALAAGRTVPEMARALFISPHTVHTHIRSILAKLGVRSRLNAVLLAFRHGVIRTPLNGPQSP